MNSVLTVEKDGDQIELPEGSTSKTTQLLHLRNRHLGQ